jgi:hypothetical protein
MRRKQLAGNIAIHLAYFIWGYGEDEMPYGPPCRGWMDRLALNIYTWGLPDDGRCKKCGK